MDEILKTYVRSSYEVIASHFSKTRWKPWPEVVEFIRSQRPQNSADLCCGNGRHSLLLAENGHVACVDFCRRLLDEARMRAEEKDLAYRCHFVLADVEDLPFRDEVFDTVLYIAAIHHVPTLAGRMRSLREVRRVLRPGGKGLISAWSVHQSRFEEDRIVRCLELMGRRIELQGNDVFLPWTMPDGRVIYRFYHLFDEAEFHSLHTRVFRQIKTFVSRDNLFAVVSR